MRLGGFCIVQDEEEEEDTINLVLKERKRDGLINNLNLNQFLYETG